MVKAKLLIFIIAIFAVVVFIIFWAKKNRIEDVRPPIGIKDLSKFLEAKPHPHDIRIFIQDGNTYIEVIGEIGGSILALPSGPPVYIFNEYGVLVDWTADSGDTPLFAKKWGNLQKGKSINTEEAKRSTKAKPASSQESQ